MAEYKVKEGGEDVPFGCFVTAGIECMYGSAMYLITTGMSQSHPRIDLSSDVDKNRRFSSTNVSVLTGPKCSYVCTISFIRVSYFSSASAAPAPPTADIQGVKIPG